MTDAFLRDLIALLRRIALAQGVVLERRDALLPLNLPREGYPAGVIACVAHVLDLVRQTPEGRKALLDLGFEPVLEDVERPRHGGADD
ncbi:hypothetical protein [Ralstonia mannitolilytica]|uniref:hypothetical protein n=1 Tax=Ralstonia mannitolilytica TaxID=105219 RepID=UPI00292F4464|nr:hypothetical protein [Ralstonia mannitolilytica]